MPALDPDRAVSSSARARAATGLGNVLILFCGFVAGLALTRLLFEARFPRTSWLGHPSVVLPLALLTGIALWVAWRRRWPDQTIQSIACFLPLLLNLAVVTSPGVTGISGGFLFGASLWLVAAMCVARLRSARRVLSLTLLLGGGLLLVYLATLGRTVGRADTFEFQVVIPRLGIVHPTGYPLYLLLGKLFTFIPLQSVAWRINLASAVYAVLALVLVFLLLWHLTKSLLPSLAAAVALGLTTTFWSQAIEAEVYTLHALFVSAALLLIVLLLEPLATGDHDPAPARTRHRFLLLAFLFGLGLTNHLTTVLLMPAVATLIGLYFLSGRRRVLFPSWRSLLETLLAFLAPLTLYLYLPARWAAVNGEPMGFERFVDWVIGGRFQGALQLSAWLNDPQRYRIVARLLLTEWQPSWLLLLAAVGLLTLFARQWRVALVLLLTWLAYVFYALSYYVPDLAVFLLPAQLIQALFWGVGLAALAHLLTDRLAWAGAAPVAILSFLALAPLLITASNTWVKVDRADDDGGTTWGAGVLRLPLARDAAILADSERFPPLYYLQQAEGQRPDLDILVLPDEAAYRAELHSRLANGQVVYLARYLPGLQGQYYLRSLGPLLEVSPVALTTLPSQVTDVDLSFDDVTLRGYDFTAEADVDPGAAAVTFYWQANDAVTQSYRIYVRWLGDAFVGTPQPPAGQLPANNAYPTNAWRPGEIIADFHLLAPPPLNETQSVTLQVAVAPPFTAAEEMQWQTVTEVTLPPAQLKRAEAVTLQFDRLFVDGVSIPQQTRPETTIDLQLAGCGNGIARLEVSLQPAEGERTAGTATNGWTASPCARRFVHRRGLDVNVRAGLYDLVARLPRTPARCGWLQPVSDACRLGQVEVSGVPLPVGATNFDDKIALLSASLTDSDLRAGGTLAVTLDWQGLAPLDENYTVFVQMVDAQDQIIVQQDSWPVQGTYATSQWDPAEVVADPYRLQLPGDLQPGNYRLLVGWYLLATQQRLPVLDIDGNPIDDKVVIPIQIAQ